MRLKLHDQLPLSLDLDCLGKRPICLGNLQFSSYLVDRGIELHRDREAFVTEDGIQCDRITGMAEEPYGRRLQ